MTEPTYILQEALHTARQQVAGKKYPVYIWYGWKAGWYVQDTLPVGHSMAVWSSGSVMPICSEGDGGGNDSANVR